MIAAVIIIVILNINTVKYLLKNENNKDL